MQKFLIYMLGINLIIASCTKKGTLDRDYWTKKEAGTYTITNIRTVTYTNTTLVSDVTETGDNTEYTLSPDGGDGFGLPLTISGTWKPYFLKSVFASGYAWTVENDDKRLTIGHFDPVTGFFADATLSVDNMKKSTQNWTYIRSSTTGNVDTYIVQTITAQRK